MYQQSWSRTIILSQHVEGVSVVKFLILNGFGYCWQIGNGIVTLGGIGIVLIENVKPFAAYSYLLGLLF
jgi:hypothetical protein